MKQTHNRVDLAKEQLDVALELFLSHRSDVSALTTLEDLYNCIVPIEELMRRKPFPLRDYITEKNHARNAAKHMDDRQGQLRVSVDVDMNDEAAKMLARACDHYRRLGFPVTDLIAEFDDWFYRNVVG